MDGTHLLASITGTVDQALLLRNAYLVTENRILRHQLKGRVRLSDGERKALAEMGQKLGKQALQEVAQIVTPDTMLGWHRTRIAQKFDVSFLNIHYTEKSLILSPGGSKLGGCPRISI
jgi:hypothetical protein